MKQCLCIGFILISLFSYGRNSLTLEIENKLSTNFLKATYFQIDNAIFLNSVKNKYNSDENLSKLVSKFDFVMNGYHISMLNYRIENVGWNYLSDQKNQQIPRYPVLTYTLLGTAGALIGSGIDNITNNLPFFYKGGRTLLIGVIAGTVFGMVWNNLELMGKIRYKKKRQKI